jgi:HSP20 family protein
MDRFFDSFFERYPKERSEGFWAPTLDIEEDKDNFMVNVELPGMKKEDIKISLSGETLTISGERRYESEEKGKTYFRLERAYGKFQRTLNLPAEVDANRTKASYQNGILTLTMPKSERAKAKEIAIEVK